jgi:redox-sensitive bicupin YhaK (pirin superfamily)
VLLGSAGGLVSPVTAPVSARIIDIDMVAGATLDEHVPTSETGFAVIRSGEVETAAGVAGPGTAVFAQGSTLRLTARTDARLTVFGGAPLRHRVITAGPFVASTEGQVRAFRQRFASGGMGRLTAFDQEALDRDFDTNPNPKGA